MNDVSARMSATAQAAHRIHPVLLSGGAGTRLWPLSRRHYPKQLLPLLTERTMLQETASRTAGFAGAAQPLVVCHQDHRFLVSEQLQAIGVVPQSIVLEPVARNTAPALVAAALVVQASDPDGVLLVQPSDHHIANGAAFRDVLARAAEAAATGALVTFGIRPTRPETGYGYIEGGDALDGVPGALSVKRFVEKPDRETAQRFQESGAYFWNSGMFMLPVATFLEEVGRHQPRLLAACTQAVNQGREDLGFFRLEEAAFGRAESISVDNAIMEKTDRLVVLPVEMGWSDIGSWRSLRDTLRELRPADSGGNVVDGDAVLEDVRNCHIKADGRMVAALGVENLVIVATDDAVLVADADRASDVGRLVDELRRRNRQEVLHHSTVHRPWGTYQSVDAGDRFQVKRITVKPGAQLSLQMHHHRAEHWVVVHGTACVTCDGKSRLLHENQSTYIPMGATHRLENPGKLPLHLIEVQSGSYLGEDDIVRFEDTYGRG